MFIWFFYNLKHMEGVVYFKEAIKSFGILCVLGLLSIPIGILNDYIGVCLPTLAYVLQSLLFYFFSVILMGSLLVYQIRLKNLKK